MFSSKVHDENLSASALSLLSVSAIKEKAQSWVSFLNVFFFKEEKKNKEKWDDSLQTSLYEIVI